MKQVTQAGTWRLSNKNTQDLITERKGLVKPRDTKRRVCIAHQSPMSVEWFGDWPDWESRLKIFHHEGLNLAKAIHYDQALVCEIEETKYYVANQVTFMVAYADVLLKNVIVGSQGDYNKVLEGRHVRFLRKALLLLGAADACQKDKISLWSVHSGLAIKIDQLFADINSMRLPEEAYAKRVEGAEISLCPKNLTPLQPRYKQLFRGHDARSRLESRFQQPISATVISEQSKTWSVSTTPTVMVPVIEMVPPLKLLPISRTHAPSIHWEDAPKSCVTDLALGYSEIAQNNAPCLLTAATFDAEPVDVAVLLHKDLSEMQLSLVSDADVALLLQHGYTLDEVEKMVSLGASPRVLNKLASRSEQKFNASEAVACIETCVAMGAKEAEKAQDKELLLVIGNTGVGKSTAVNYLHGCTMKREMRGGRHVIISDSASEIAEVALIGHESSKTFVPMVVDSSPAAIHFCDCPGFFDQRGAEIDIANAINIQNMIKQAQSVKILLLIHYRDSVDPRGVGLDILMETLRNLFGLGDDASSLQQYANNIVIGITQAPLLIDDFPISSSDIVQQMIVDGNFPESLRSRILVLDPLGRRDAEGCSQKAWLKKISEETTPILNPNGVFKTVLTSSNVLRLIEISHEILLQTEQSLEKRDYVQAYRHVKNMQSILVIDREETQNLFQNIIDAINKFFTNEEVSIQEQCRKGCFSLAEESILSLQKFSKIFSEFDITLTSKFRCLVDFYDEQRLKLFSHEVEQLTSDLSKKIFDTIERSDRDVNSMDLILNGASVSVKDEAFLHYWLSRLSAKSDIIQVSESAKSLDNKLIEMAAMCSQMQKLQLFKEVELQCHHKIRDIGIQVRQANEKNIKRQLLSIEIELHEQFSRLRGLCSWKQSGDLLLQILAPVRKIKSFSELLKIIQALRNISYINECVSKIYEYVQQAYTHLCRLDNASLYDTISQLVHAALFELMKDLEIARNNALIARHAAREEAMIWQFSHGFQVAMSEKNYDHAGAYIAVIPMMTIAQTTQLAKSIDFEVVLMNQLDELLHEFKSVISWEQHGPSLLKECKKGAAGLSAILGACRSLSRDGLMLGAQTRSIGYLVYFVQKLQQTYPTINSTPYLARIDLTLKQVVITLTKEKQAQAARKAEERRLQEATTLVTLINTDLLPNNKIQVLAQAYNRLEQIAANHTKMIPLENTVRQHVQDFGDSLLSKSYQTALDKMILLDQFQHEMALILTRRGIEVDASQYESEVVSHLRSVLPAVEDEFFQSLTRPSIRSIDSPLKPAVKLGSYFDALDKFNRFSSVNTMHDTLSEHIKKTVFKTFKEFESLKDPKIYARLLMQVQAIITEIGPRDVQLSSQLNEQLVADMQKRDNDVITATGVLLIQFADKVSSASRSASELIDRHAVFKEARTSKFIQETKGRTSKNILDELKADNKPLLERAYQCYDKCYWELIRKLKRCSETGSPETALIEATVSDAREKGRSLEGQTNFSDKLEVLSSMLADACAVWSYLEAGRKELTDASVIRTPHSAQVLAVLMLLGLDTSRGMRNHLVQVLTGEGKSLVIAFYAISLALIGYHVDVACYTPYLSGRDEKCFKPLFVQMGVIEQINYGDLHKLSMKFVELKVGSVDSMTLSFIKNEPVYCESSKSRKQILIFDEADVPYSENFLRQTVTFTSLIKDKNIKELFEKIWNNRADYASMGRSQFINDISSSKQINKFLGQYPRAKGLISDIVSEIYEGFQEVYHDRHQYECVNETIGYRDQQANTIRFGIFYGYSTAFAAVKESKLGRVSSENLQVLTSISVSCANIAYSLIPTAYDNVIGVSGTLPFDGPQKKLLDKYKITSLSRIPSVFSKKPVEDMGVAICAGDMHENKEGAYFYSIRQKADEMIGLDRSVLIIFEDEKRLKEYENFIRLHPYAHKSIIVNTLTIDTQDMRRDTIIAETATRGKVTMVVREYGRGSDFICNDSQLRSAGGLMVLCTFLPETQSEYIQIRGRTGRQNDPGSYKEILYLADLQKFGIKTHTEIDENQAGVRAYLNEKRQKYNEAKYGEIEAGIKEAESKHHATFEYVRLLSSLGSSSIFSHQNNSSVKVSASQEAELIALIKKFK